jgi:NADH:ubiquinone oxidoreductase subunit 6 (subunit J)
MKMMMMSLRNLIRSQGWWAVVLVLWAFAFLGVFQSIKTEINWGFPIAIMITLIIFVAKVAEYLTRPDQTVQQAAKTHKEGK